MRDDLHTFRAMTPGSLTGDKPKNYGAGRRCACGTKIMQYRKGDRCGLCADDDERHARAVAAREAEMSATLWKSKDHPDGCRECPEGEKFKRRHAGNGLCSLHRSRAKRNGTLDAKANDVADAARAITLEATSVDNGTKLDRHLAALPDPRMDGRVERQTVPEHHCAGEDCDPACDGREDERRDDPGPEPGDDEPIRCCGAKDDPLDDCGGPECEHRDLFAEPETGCDVEGCCVGVIARFATPVFDREVAAMALVVEALEPLDRGARVRALKWVAARLGVDRPAPGTTEDEVDLRPTRTVR